MAEVDALVTEYVDHVKIVKKYDNGLCRFAYFAKNGAQLCESFDAISDVEKMPQYQK